MPELPEVETLRRQLAPVLVNRRMLSVTSDASVKFSGAADAAGCTVAGLRRRGKYLIVELTPTPGAAPDRELVLHLGMTGQLWWQRSPADHVRARFELDSGVLTLRDPRGFGRARVVLPGRYEEFPTLSRLGPDPLDGPFDVTVFARALAQASGGVKALLLEQRLVAGVGNYLADETLWQARVHPSARGVSVAAGRRIGDALVDLVHRSVAAGGVSERDYQHLDGSLGTFAGELSCYGRAGLPCARCAATLRKSTVAGRGTTWCPRCQRLRAAPRR